MLKALLYTLLLLATTSSIAQQNNKNTLVKQRSAIQKEMDDAKHSLAETSRNRKKSLAQVILVQKKMELREQQIRAINQQINLIDKDIRQNSKDISMLKTDLDTITKQYEKAVVYSYKNSSNYDFLYFIFSATSFNDALKRINYLNAYRDYRKDQANAIRRTQDLIQQKTTALMNSHNKKNLILLAENKEKTSLAIEKKTKDAIVTNLLARENELKKEIAGKKKTNLKIELAIRAAIAETGRKKTGAVRERTVKKEITAATVSFPLKANKKRPEMFPEESSETNAISASFESSKRTLSWPVQGVITMHFGRHHYKGSDLIFPNPGITIEANGSAFVKAVFDGTVSGIFDLGPNLGVTIRHGKYITTYCNLTNLTISTGQTLKKGQIIGNVAETSNGKGELEFVITKDRENLDPEKWLRK